MDSLAFNPDNKKERTDKAIAWLITLLIHGGILLFLLLYIIITPIPPYPETKSPELEVELVGGGGSSGNPGIGSSGGKASAETTTNRVAAVHSANMPTVNNNVEPTTPIPSENATKVPRKTDTVAKPQQPQIDIQLASALNRFKNAKASSGGNSNSGEAGNGGSLNGGNPGTGLGGTGGGGGRGGGKGFGYDLSGRELVRRPYLVTNNPEEGQIVVGITVDQDGNVIDAVPGVRGSTITDASLYILVKNAAMKVKFNSSPNTPEQTGTVTFRFTIQ